MHIIDHDKVTYVLGLKWTETEGGDPQAHLRDVVGAQQCAFHALGKRRAGQLVGYTPQVEHFVGKGKKKSPICLVAAVLAMGQDGIHVLSIEEGLAWLCVIHDGKLLLTPDGAETVLPIAKAVGSAKEMAKALQLPLYADGCMSEGALPFSLAEITPKQRKGAELRVTSKSNNLVGGIVLAAVVCGIGYGVMATLADEKPRGSSADTQAAIERETYVNNVSASLPVMESDPSWVISAHSLAHGTFPSLVEGWSLTKVACEPSQCIGVYEVSKKASGFSLAGLKQRFGANRVHVLAGQETVNVAIDRESAQRIWDATEILEPVRQPVDIVDLIGVLPVRMPQIEVESGFNSSEINVGTRPSMVRPMYRETIVTKSDARAMTAVVALQVELLGQAGFVPATLLMNSGEDSIGEGWRIEWVRINGGPA